MEKSYEVLISSSPTPALIVVGASEVSELEIKSLFLKYGRVVECVLFTNFSLVQFTEIQPAEFLYSLVQKQPLCFKNISLTLFYSNKLCNEYIDDLGENCTRILELNISNLVYKIDVSVITSVCCTYGKLQKIYIGYKSKTDGTLNVYVEFEKISDTRLAREALDDVCIYPNCNRISAKFSLLPHIFIEENNDFTWSIDLEGSGSSNLSSPVESLSTSSDSSDSSNNCIIECKNVPSDLTLDNYYNLFSLFGRVVRIKYTNDKLDSILVEMDKSYSVSLCKTYLNDKVLSGKNLKITTSNIKKLLPKSENETKRNVLFKDFSKDVFYQSLLNFDMKRPRNTQPSKTLYFYNAPAHFSEVYFRRLLSDHGAPQPNSIALFRRQGENICNNGLMEFPDLSDALLAICLINNRQITENASDAGTHLKLVFSNRQFVNNEDANLFRTNRVRKIFRNHKTSEDNYSVVQKNEAGIKRKPQSSDGGNISDSWSYDFNNSDKENRPL